MMQDKKGNLEDEVVERRVKKKGGYAGYRKKERVEKMEIQEKEWM